MFSNLYSDKITRLHLMTATWLLDALMGEADNSAGLFAETGVNCPEEARCHNYFREIASGLSNIGEAGLKEVDEARRALRLWFGRDRGEFTQDDLKAVSTVLRGVDGFLKTRLKDLGVEDVGTHGNTTVRALMEDEYLIPGRNANIPSSYFTEFDFVVKQLSKPTNKTDKVAPISDPKSVWAEYAAKSRVR